MPDPTPAEDPRETCARVCDEYAEEASRAAWRAADYIGNYDIVANAEKHEKIARTLAAAIRALPPFAAQPQSEAVEALKQYTVHGFSCDKRAHITNPCSCGLDSILAAVEKEGGRG